jgi:hypothetical protein
MNGAPIFVLVLAQPLVPILDKLFKAKKFEWAAPSISPERGGNLVELIEDRFAYLIQLKK